MKTRKQNEWDDSYNYGDVGVGTQNEFILYSVIIYKENNNSE